MTRLFTLFGWEFKSGEDDLKPMAAAFSPLGVEISFEEPGFAVVANTKKRTTKAVAELQRLAVAQAHPNSELLQILGISQFMESQTHGRCGALLMRRIRQEMRDPAITGVTSLRSCGPCKNISRPHNPGGFSCSGGPVRLSF